MSGIAKLSAFRLNNVDGKPARNLPLEWDEKSIGSIIVDLRWILKK
jgi:hypothetical protein